MYAHSKFRTASADMALEVVERYPFANVITSCGGVIRSSHLPVVLAEDCDRAAVAAGEWSSLRLIGHLARANAQAAEIDGAPVLILFQSPNAYVTPTWYGTIPSAPTWNYVDVQVRGRLLAYKEPDEALDVILRTIRVLESGRDPEWRPGPSMEYIQKILPGIVAFRVEIESVDYQFKLSQDKTPDQIDGVVAGLSAATDTERAVAALMARYLPRLRTAPERQTYMG